MRSNATAISSTSKDKANRLSSCGLFGALSNWVDVVGHFSQRYRVIIPFNADLYAPGAQYQCESTGRIHFDFSSTNSSKT